MVEQTIPQRNYTLNYCSRCSYGHCHMRWSKPLMRSTIKPNKTGMNWFELLPRTHLKDIVVSINLLQMGSPWHLITMVLNYNTELQLCPHGYSLKLKLPRRTELEQTTESLGLALTYYTQLNSISWYRKSRDMEKETKEINRENFDRSKLN